MAEQWQIRRDTAAIVYASTPALSELVYVTDTHTLVIGDGATIGGIPIGAGPGDAIWNISATERPGIVAANGRTIGSASATNAALKGAKYKPLYVALWNAWDDGEAPVEIARGSTAEDDWNDNKFITMPDLRRRFLFGADPAGDLGDAIPLGMTGGAEKVALTEANNGPHSHGLRAFGREIDGGGAEGDRTVYTGVGYVDGYIESSGSGTPHENMPPYIAGTWFFKL